MLGRVDPVTTTSVPLRN